MSLDVFFLHVPKTAGSSLVRQFVQNGYEHWDLNVHAERPSEPAVKRLYSGHISYKDARRRIKRGTRSITLLRHPFSRALSLYNWYLMPVCPFTGESRVGGAHHAAALMGWDYWLAHAGDTLKQVYWFGSSLKEAKRTLERFDFVGVFERLDVLNECLSASFGLEGSLPHVNTQSYFDVSVDMEEASHSFADDLALYEHALKLINSSKSI